jgi:glc operon protein GlcG
MSQKIAPLVAAAAFALAAAAAQAAPPPYGAPITLDQAKKIAAAAVAASPKISSQPDVVAIVDSGAHLVYLERMDNAQIGSIRVAIGKARSAVLYRRPTKVFDDLLAKGRTTLLALPGVSPSEGGLPIVVGGKLIGAIGASGGSPEEDGKVAAAGLAALK